MVSRMLSAGEQERCGRTQRALRDRCLCDAWAVREAALKYLGIGLAVHPRVLRVSCGDAELPAIRAGDITVMRPTLWRVDAPQLPAMNVLAVWSEDAGCSMAVASGPVLPLVISRQWIG